MSFESDVRMKESVAVAGAVAREPQFQNKLTRKIMRMPGMTASFRQVSLLRLQRKLVVS